MDHQQEISQILTEPQYTSLPVEINKGHVNHGVSQTQGPLEEPLLEENPNRFVLFPIKYSDIWKMYKD
jgi:ribonucleotide reductase beta subunit family protein with ferritin-like domain